MTRVIIILAAIVALGARPLPRTIVVTAYCPCAECCGKWAAIPDAQRTFADGTRFDRNAKVCAVDTRVFTFGTRFDIPGHGEYVAHDTGGKIKGSHIDILMPTHAEAKAYGRRLYSLERK